MVPEELVRAVIAERRRQTAELRLRDQALVGRRRSAFGPLLAWAQRVERRDEPRPCPDTAAAIAAEAGVEG